MLIEQETSSSQMKIGSIGERAGAAFEIIGLDLFSGPGQRIVPAPAYRPGYDGSVAFDDGSSLMELRSRFSDEVPTPE